MFGGGGNRVAAQARVARFLLQFLSSKDGGEGGVSGAVPTSPLPGGSPGRDAPGASKVLSLGTRGHEEPGSCPSGKEGGRPGPTQPRNYQLHSLPPGSWGPLTYVLAGTRVHLPAEEGLGRGCSRAQKSAPGGVEDWCPTTGLLSGTCKEVGEVLRNSFEPKYDAP